MRDGPSLRERSRLFHSGDIAAIQLTRRHAPRICPALTRSPMSMASLLRCSPIAAGDRDAWLRVKAMDFALEADGQARDLVGMDPMEFRIPMPIGRRMKATGEAKHTA